MKTGKNLHMKQITNSLDSLISLSQKFNLYKTLAIKKNAKLTEILKSLSTFAKSKIEKTSFQQK